MAKKTARDKEIRRQAKLKRQRAKAARKGRAGVEPGIVVLTGHEKERVFGKQRISELLLEFALPVTEKLPDDPPAEWFEELLQVIAETWNRGMNFPKVEKLEHYHRECDSLAESFEELLSIDREEGIQLVAFLLKRRMDHFQDRSLIFGPVTVVDEGNELRVMASAALASE